MKRSLFWTIVAAVIGGASAALLCEGVAALMAIEAGWEAIGPLALLLIALLVAAEMWRKRR